MFCQFQITFERPDLIYKGDDEKDFTEIEYNISKKYLFK